MNTKIIDIHSHFNCGFKDDVPNNNIHKRDFEFLMEEYKNCGISAGCFSHFPAVLGTSDIYECNELMYKKAESDDRVYQWIVLDPRQEKLFPQVRKMITGKKVVGIKIQSLTHKYDIVEYGDKVFSLANELKCFVLMHNDKILDMVQFADKYPDMNLIIAHLGSDEHVEAIKKAKHGNIYTDTSGGRSYFNNVVEYAVEQVGSEKIFFGTDTYSCGFQTGRILFARISDKDKENILYYNAKRHFPKQFANI